MKLELTDSINQSVRSKFLIAKASKSLVFSPTELTTIWSRDGVPFQLRYCPALSQKPGTSNSGPANLQSTTSKLNPFENPSGDLLVARLPNEKDATHNLILNKYPVIPNHTILSTVPFRKQTDLLDNQDLDITYSCLQAWDAESTTHSPSKLFAFFNSGEHSGASQAHRHLQFLPVEDMMDTGLPSSEWQPLIDLMRDSTTDKPDVFSISRLPLRHFAMKIPQSPSTRDLQGIYHNLYNLAYEWVHGSLPRQDPKCTVMDYGNGEASISYNLAMTTSKMAICPRRSENAVIRTNGVEGSTAANGTILAGTLMVKEQSDWEVLRHGHVMIDDLLEEIGVPLSPRPEDVRSTRL